MNDKVKTNLRRIVRVRPLSVLVLVIMLAATGVTASVNGRIIDEHQHRLLEERSAEVAVYLESLMREIELTFPFLAGVLQLTPDPLAAFPEAATPLLESPIRGVGIAQESGGTYTVLASVGDTIPAGDAVDGGWAPLLRRAARENDLVTGVLPSDSGTVVGLAFAAEGAPVVLFEELLFIPAETLERDADSPFGDLDGLVYAARERDASSLVVSTSGETRMSDGAVEQFVNVGADKWLLVTATDGSLVDGFALNARWGVLIGGLLVSLLTAALIEMLSRRRVYALGLVEERTTELRAALEERARLEGRERQAREAAEDANHSKSEFLSRMSHELRTPLNAVLGFAQLLELDELTPKQQDSVGQILKGGRHLLNLINEVLDISRIESGSFSLSTEPVLVRDAIDDVVSLMQPLAEAHEIGLTVVAGPESSSFVLADAQRLRQVLLNLVANAIKYNRSGGRVTVGCQLEGEARLRLTVADTGAGISDDDLKLVFAPFERLGAERTDIEGTGVGLALSRRLAEAMGGRLDVDTAMGVGSTFWLELPLVDAPALAGIGDELDRDSVPNGASRQRVLYIEDNLSNVRLVERILASRDDIDFMAAGQGLLGLDLARQHRPALVLLDLHLPDIAGDEVLRRMAADPATAEIPIIMISADATQGQVERLVAAGAYAYLTKPLDVGALLGLLDEILARVPN